MDNITIDTFDNIFNVNDFRTWLENLPQNETLPGAEAVCPLDKWLGNDRCCVGPTYYNDTENHIYLELPAWASRFGRRVDMYDHERGITMPLEKIWNSITASECLAILYFSEIESKCLNLNKRK